MLKNKKIVIASFLCFFCSSISLFCQRGKLAEWTILTYMQADNNLAPFAGYNMCNMQDAGYHADVNVLVQWIQPNSKIVNRCVLGSDSKMKIDLILPVQSTFDHQQAIINAMRWAKDNYPAKHYMLVLWNHGAGIIDHEHYPYSRHRSFLNVASSWIRLPGVDYSCARGILYSDTSQKYLNNQQLGQTLRIIKEDILRKPLDIIGMDACFMSMIEIAYQIKDYATYMVASQNSEPGRGWDYEQLLKAINAKTKTFTPLDVAKEIVTAYKNFYNPRLSFYTQSALDLSKADEVRKSIDLVVSKLFACKKINASVTENMVRRARYLATRFDMTVFIDIDSFYKNLLKSSKEFMKKTRARRSFSFKKALKNLNGVLEKGINKIKEIVFANAVGPVLKKAKGLSIYFPQTLIHSSYKETLFAQNSKWTSLLDLIVENKKSGKKRKNKSSHRAFGVEED